MLSDLDTKEYDIVLVQSNSDKMRLYILDKLKAKYNSTQDTMIQVNSTKDLKVVRELSGVVPPFSLKWLITVALGKSVSIKDLVSTIDVSSTCTFLIVTEKYKDFKEIKDLVKKKHSTIDLYLSYLRRSDFIYLYDALVPKDKQMKKQLFDYLVSSYSSDIESVFNLLLAMNGGKKIESRKDIADICGIGGLTIDSFVFSLLKEPPKTEKGLKKVLNNRVLAGKELIAVYRCDKFYNFMRSCLFNLTQLKTLKSTGVIYKSIRGLPECYDETKLVRYQRYLWKLDEIPLSRILRLYSSMGNTVWRTDIDFLYFIYNYFKRSYSDGKVNLKEVRGGKK